MSCSPSSLRCSEPNIAPTVSLILSNRFIWVQQRGLCAAAARRVRWVATKPGKTITAYLEPHRVSGLKPLVLFAITLSNLCPCIRLHFNRLLRRLHNLQPSCKVDGLGSALCATTTRPASLFEGMPHYSRIIFELDHLIEALIRHSCLALPDPAE